MIELAMVGFLIQAGTTPAVTIGDIRMHLFYAETGRLSRDISPPNAFTGWNTIIGEGDAEENANDLAVVVELRTNGQQNVPAPLTVTVRDARGRVLGQRRFPASLTGQNGRAYHLLHLANATCAGRITVTATYGGRSRDETLALNCGE
ncbi:MAG: hypothetical protein AB7O91_07565 [Sphingomonas sp.]